MSFFGDTYVLRNRNDTAIPSSAWPKFWKKILADLTIIMDHKISFRNCILHIQIVRSYLLRLTYTDTSRTLVLFLDIRSRWKKLKLKLKNSKLQILADVSEDFLTKYSDFCVKSGKIYQKLKSLPKTQSKISKNQKLKFPANPLSSKARKTSQKKPGMHI